MSEKQLTRSRLVSGRVIAGGLCCLIACLFIVLSTIPETDAAPRRKSKKKKTPAKKEEPLPPRFMVKSKPVSSSKLSSAISSARTIDQLVQANYTKHRIKPNPIASDAQFVRRVYLDIAGRIPTYIETRLFIVSRKQDKKKVLIDKLLNSDDYASHFYNYWADVLRYTDRLNNSVKGEPYRQWIKQSLAENKPWDKMVYEMQVAEGLVWENPASGYLQRDAGMPLDNMNNTVRIFLGTRIGCAQCHDHPFDRWTQKEFYQMAAFTYGTTTRVSGRDKRFYKKGDPNKRLKSEYYDIEQDEEIQRKNYYRMTRVIRYNMMIVNDNVKRKIRLPHDYQYDNAKPKQVIPPKTLFGKPANIKPGEAPRVAFARWLTSKDNPRFAKTIANRLWKRLFGLGQIEPVDDMMDTTVAENPALMKFLESEMKRVNFDMKEYLRIILNSKTYQREASDEPALGTAYHFQGPVLRRMSAEQVWDSFLTLAVSNPSEYREFPSNVRSEFVSADLNSVSPQDLLAGDDEARKVVDRGRSKRQKKYMYQNKRLTNQKKILLARASELPSPVPPAHFLRTFGQSDRELISSSSTFGSVPQVLFMFNGPITHMMLEEGSVMYKNVTRKKKMNDRINVIFMSILNRMPDSKEMKVALQEIKKNGPAGYGNVIWSLVNTREFLFIQ